MSTNLHQVLAELTMELGATAEKHAQHNMTPRDVQKAVIESFRLAQQAQRLAERATRRAA